jgi:hypothetical protein
MRPELHRKTPEELEAVHIKKKDGKGFLSFGKVSL